MYSCPSTSQIFAPLARSTKNGVRPMPRNARTGELTPPGIRACAAAKSSADECFIAHRFARRRAQVYREVPTLTAPERAHTLRRQFRRGSQVVRQGSAKALFVGSIPAPASLPRSMACLLLGSRRASFTYGGSSAFRRRVCECCHSASAHGQRPQPHAPQRLHAGRG